MSAPPASDPYNPGNDYFISPFLKDAFRKGITKEEVDMLYAAQEALIGKRRVCMTSPQLAMTEPLQRHEDFMVSAKGTISALQQMKKGMSRHVDLEKAPGLVTETCGFVQVYKDWSDKFSKSGQEIDHELLRSLFPKLKQLADRKEDDPNPVPKITQDELSNVAKLCNLGKQMCNEMPKPVSASEGELEKLGQGFNYIFKMLNATEKHSKKLNLLSPGEVVELHGASESVNSHKAKNEYINALREAGLSDEKIKELTGFSNEQFKKISEPSSKRPAGDEPAEAGGATKKVKVSAAKAAPAAAPAAAIAAAGPAPAEPPAAAAAAPAVSPAAAPRPSENRRGAGETRRNPAAVKSALEAMKPKDAA